MDDEQFWVEGDLSCEDIGGIVKSIREHKGLTIEQMANDLGMKSFTRLANNENGAQKPGLKLITDVCEKYGMEATLHIRPKQT